MSKLIRNAHTTAVINGSEIPATIVQGPDALLSLYGSIKPDKPYIAWAKAMHDCGIAEHLMTDSGQEFKIIDLLLPAEEVETP